MYCIDIVNKNHLATFHHHTSNKSGLGGIFSGGKFQRKIPEFSAMAKSLKVAKSLKTAHFNGNRT